MLGASDRAGQAAAAFDGSGGAEASGRAEAPAGASDRLAGAAEPGAAPDALPPWAELLAREAARQLAASSDGAVVGLAGEPAELSGVMARFTRIFEATMIRAALGHTRGRRVEAAQRLGIGRNTITRKIQELGLDD